nr:fibrinogen-like protein 1 [Cherax quadricarinatus]
MMKLLVIILTIKCIMVSANIPSNDPTTINTSPYDTSSHSSTTRSIRRIKRRSPAQHQLTDDQFKETVLARLNEITESIERNRNILQEREASVADERRARCETQHNNTKHQLHKCQKNLRENIITSPPARDCSDIHHRGVTESGVYRISPQSSAEGVSVLCTIEEEHMWTVFLFRQRQTPQENFNRPWQDYKTGFGDPRGEYWLGNDNLHALTSGGRRYRLKVIATNLQGEQHSAEWETFKVANEANKYKLTVGGYTSTSTNTLGDALAIDINGRSFTTLDRDNDESDGNCAVHRGGGWWYNNCAWATATSPLCNIADDERVLYWRNFNPGEDGHRTSLSQLLMMITTDTTTTDTTQTQH